MITTENDIETPVSSRERIYRQTLDHRSGLFRDHFTVNGTAVKDDLLGFFISDLDEICREPENLNSRGLYITYGLDGAQFVPTVEVYRLSPTDQLLIKKDEAYMTMYGRWIKIKEADRKQLETSYRERVKVDEGDGNPIPGEYRSTP
jgi:hypothetical protein